MQFSEFYVTSTRKTGSFVTKSKEYEKKIYQSQQQFPSGLTAYDSTGTGYRSTVPLSVFPEIITWPEPVLPELNRSAYGHPAA